MRSHHFYAGGCTVCLDTPENPAHFQKIKSQIQSGRPSPASLAKQNFNRALQAQIAKENKALRKFSTFLPGHGPNRL